MVKKFVACPDCGQPMRHEGKQYDPFTETKRDIFACCNELCFACRLPRLSKPQQFSPEERREFEGFFPVENAA